MSLPLFIDRPYRYYLTHPIQFCKALKRECKFAYQRVTRGYDDSVAWSVDWWCAEHFPAIIRSLKDTGHPGDLTQPEWNDILEQISAGFDAALVLLENICLSVDDPTRHEDAVHTFDVGMSLFKEHFFQLWD